MRNFIGLITLFSIAVGNAQSQPQIRSQRIEFDTVINGGYFHFRMNNTEIGSPNAYSNKSDFDKAGVINTLESERKGIEKELHAIEEYIDSMRVVLFTNVLGLTKKEADIFWPTYNEYQIRLNKILKRRKEASDKLCDPFRKYKFKEYATFVDMEVKSYREEALLREQYGEKFKTILGENFYLLYRAEYLFIRWIYSNF